MKRVNAAASNNWNTLTFPKKILEGDMNTAWFHLDEGLHKPIFFVNIATTTEIQLPPNIKSRLKSAIPYGRGMSYEFVFTDFQGDCIKTYKNICSYLWFMYGTP